MDPLIFSLVQLIPLFLCELVYCIHVSYTVCKGGGVWGSGPQTDKHLRKVPLQVIFLDDDILHCLYESYFSTGVLYSMVQKEVQYTAVRWDCKFALTERRGGGRQVHRRIE
jgi:hypothetical protein